MWTRSSTRTVEPSPVTIIGALPRLGSPCASDRDPREPRIRGRRSDREVHHSDDAFATSIWSARHDGSIAFIEDMERSSAYAEDHLNADAWFDTIHPDDRPRTLASWSSALRTGRPFHDVHRGRDRSGRYERFLVDGFAIRDDDDQIVCWIGAKTAIGDSEGEYAESLQSGTILVRPGHLERAPETLRQDLDQPANRSALPAQPIFVGPKVNAEHPIGEAPRVADRASRSPRAPDPDSAIGRSMIEAMSAAADAALSDSPRSLDRKLLRDSRIKALLEDLAVGGRIPAELARIYSHSLCVAVLARISSSPLIARTGARRRPIAALPKWRLARVNQYIDAHMEEPIRLENLAKAAGLTRMHFAAQFRAAVGMCPHEYLLRQRIGRAQTLLRDSGQRLVDVALSVGFQAQPHFTTVFRRYVGESPHRWRLSQGAECDANLGGPSQGRNALC